jgi:putative ABC transport system permease protein
MSPLDRKLLRDLWRIKGQAIAIAIVISLGVLMLVMMDGLVNSLQETRRAYYERYRLAEIFAPVKRAPNHIIREISQVPGVSAAEGRINGGALIDLPGIAAPIRAQAVSISVLGPPRLNDVYLAAGRRIDPSRSEEILLLEDFARAHDLAPGDTLTATMNGARRTFRIAGLAQSPEFLYAVPPGELVPDDERFAVIWMSREALGAAYYLGGAFNEALISLSRGAGLPAALDRIDRILEPYGGTGAYGLEDHVSDIFVSEEISSLKISSRIVPPIFLAVAAFLLYIVISRIIQSEREQIGLLKAFGYTSVEVSTHYFKLILLIATGGAALGCILGVMSGRGLAVVYQNYYKFPFLVFQVDNATFLTGVLVSIGAASAGGVFVLRRVFTLTPAVAMRPPAPADFSRAVRLGGVLKRLLDQPSRMILRRLIRQPGRALAAMLGIAAGMGLSSAVLSSMSSFNTTIEWNFGVIDRSDVTVIFNNPRGGDAIHRLQRMDGVVEVEPFRSVPAILRNGFETHRGGISGLVAEPRLYRAVDGDLAPIHIREDGVILSEPLARILKIGAGDMLTVEVREGRRPTLRVPVVGIAEALLGSPAYMELGALNSALREDNRVSGAYLRIDAARSDAIYRELKDMPVVAGVSIRSEVRAAFQKLLDQGAGAMRYIMALIAGIITFGIVYNTARIAFAEYERDLASLRVIGFTRGETAYVLLGELGIITLLALPVGSFFGYHLSKAMAEGFSTDLYQIPVVFAAESYGAAAAAVLLAAAVSGWIVKRDVDRIDPVSALKTRE